MKKVIFMKDIRVLDCTLRDGGRLIDCSFTEDNIIGIAKQLTKAGVDIIELGFLRNIDSYAGGSTFFGRCEDADFYLRKIDESEIRNGVEYVLFIDYGLYDIGKIIPARDSMVTGIRYGFTKKNFIEHKNEIIAEISHIQKLGYHIYLQDVNTNGYEQQQLVEVLHFANEIHPCSFGIVDTYGSMYVDDLEQIWLIVDDILTRDICVDFHSHNNMQMSFALSQRLIQLARGHRNLIVDSTLLGMGKCAGNLNTELIVDYLSRKLNLDYNEDDILDAIDRYLLPYQEVEKWGYSIPAFMAGVFQAHPNNVIYLTEKYRLNNRDIKYILSGIEKNLRQRYDYDNIARVYKKYQAAKVEDSDAIQSLKKVFKGKEVVILVPGSSISHYCDDIKQYIAEKSPLVICVNGPIEKLPYDYIFCANTIHWEKISDRVARNRCILTSNIHVDVDGSYRVDYTSLIQEDSELGDNTTIMLLYLLKKLEVISIVLAGFDGLRANARNYAGQAVANMSSQTNYKRTNAEIKRLFQAFVKKINGLVAIEFITPSLYE